MSIVSSSFKEVNCHDNDRLILPPSSVPEVPPLKVGMTGRTGSGKPHGPAPSSLEVAAGVPVPLVYYKAHISTDFILEVEAYERDTVYRMRRVVPFRVGGGLRTGVCKFSDASRRRLLFLIRNTERFWKVWVDLTYPASFPLDGRTVKRHLGAFIAWMRRKGISAYFWRLEFQERGAVHFHLLVTDYLHYEDIAKAWDKIIGNDWQSRGERHSASTSVGRIESRAQLYYRVSKYLAKRAQSEVPERFAGVGRFWGNTRGILKAEVARKVGHYFMLCAMTRLVRKWYTARLRSFGWRWKWKGYTFTAYDGARFLSSIRI